MIEYQVIASSSTYHQTLADDERKRHFSFSATLDKSDQIFLLLPQFLLRISLFSSVFLSPFRIILHKWVSERCP